MHTWILYSQQQSLGCIGGEKVRFLPKRTGTQLYPKFGKRDEQEAIRLINFQFHCLFPPILEALVKMALIFY